MPDPKEKKSIFDNIDYSAIAGNIVKDIPVYQPKDYTDRLDLSSSTLEGGVPAAIVGDPNAEEYLAELKAQRQGWLDKFANGTLQAANTAVIGTIGNTAGVVHGLVDLADNKSFFDNPTFKFMDEWDEAVKEAIPLYRTQKEQTGGVADRVFDKDFLFGDIFQGLGFVGSSLIPGVGWAKAGNTARTALLASRLGKLEQLAAKGIVAGSEVENLRKFIDTTSNVIKGATNLGAATMGRMYESRLEAKDVYDSTYNKSYDKRLQELLSIGTSNEEATISADEYATKQATDARNFTFGANMLLAIPDYYQYSKIFSSIGNKVNTVNKIATRSATEVLEQTPKGLIGKSANALGKVLTNEKALIAGTEALEEGAQYNIAEASKKLAEKDYDFNVSNYINEFINQSIQNIASPEFLTASLAGAVVGGGMSVLANNKKTDNPNAKIAAQDTNENAELLKTVEIAKDNLLKSTDIEQQKTRLAEVIADRNTPEEVKTKAEVTTRQLSNLQFAQTVKSNLELGKLDNYLSDIELFGTSNKEQISEDFGISFFEYDETGKEIPAKDVSARMIKRANKQVAIYQDIQTKYNNLSQISKDELFNNLVTSEYNNEKLNLVTNKITQLGLEKSNSESLEIPFSADKQSNLDNLIKEKEVLVNSQKELDNRFLEIKSGKAEGRELKIPKVEVKQEKPVVVETPIETIKSTPESKYKGSEIEVLSRKQYPSGNKVTFKVKGSTAKVTLSEAEFNKQVLGTTSTKVEEKTDLVKPKESESTVVVDDVVVNTSKEVAPITSELPVDRKKLGTATFYNSPLFFGENDTTQNRNSLLSRPDWKERFRVVLNKRWAKDKKEATVAFNNSDVYTYTNGGENALDITIEYNDIQPDGSSTWMPYGSLPYTGMLRDEKGKPYDFSLMQYPEFIKRFFITKVSDSTGVEQTIEFTEDQFNLLKIQQGIFKEFETLAKQLYSTSTEEELVLPDSTITSRLIYFINTGEIALNELNNLQGFANNKVLVISDGKINKDLSNTTKRFTVPEYLTDTYGTSNKTFINVELENGINFWTVGFVKGNN